MRMHRNRYSLEWYILNKAYFTAVMLYGKLGDKLVQSSLNLTQDQSALRFEFSNRSFGKDFCLGCFFFQFWVWMNPNWNISFYTRKIYSSVDIGFVTVTVGVLIPLRKIMIIVSRSIQKKLKISALNVNVLAMDLELSHWDVVL